MVRARRSCMVKANQVLQHATCEGRNPKPVGVHWQWTLAILLTIGIAFQGTFARRLTGQARSDSRTASPADDSSQIFAALSKTLIRELEAQGYGIMNADGSIIWTNQSAKARAMSGSVEVEGSTNASLSARSLTESGRGPSMIIANEEAASPHKVVIRAFDGPTDDSSDVGKGWMDYDKPPAPDPTGIASWRLSLEGMDEMVLSKGYGLQRHTAVTGDGYKLAIFRIPHGAAGPAGPATPGHGAARQPVLLIHGISLASTSFVVNDPDESLAFILADKGYDVWMMNTRGNTFSREHEKYDVSDSRFWAFSMDELAMDDLPAVITYMKLVTGASKVHLVGHSQGAGIALAMLSDQPEKVDDVGMLVAVGPVVYVKYLESITMTAFCASTNFTPVLAALPPQEYLFMGRGTQTLFLNGVCQTPPAVQVCVAATEAIFGTSSHITTLQYRIDGESLHEGPGEKTFMNNIKVCNDPGQMMYNEPVPKFTKFNYGAEYDLRKIKAPVIMVSGGRDVLATKKDIALQIQRLREGGSLRGTSHIDSYGHMDFIWDVGAPQKVYGAVMAGLDRFTQA